MAAKHECWFWSYRQILVKRWAADTERVNHKDWLCSASLRCHTSLPCCARGRLCYVSRTFHHSLIHSLIHPFTCAGWHRASGRCKAVQCSRARSRQPGGCRSHLGPFPLQTIYLTSLSLSFLIWKLPERVAMRVKKYLEELTYNMVNIIDSTVLHNWNWLRE